MKAPAVRSRFGCQSAAFTLIEVALALGIIAFALVAIVGSVPLAMNTGRLSIAQNRAATVAATLFANLRSWPFNAVRCLDPDYKTNTSSLTINLNLMVTTKSDTSTGYPTGTPDSNAPVKFFAAFSETTATASTDPRFNDPRRLFFFGTLPTSQPRFLLLHPPTTGPYYTIVLRFNNNPAGTLTPYKLTPTSATVYAEANGIEASIFESDRPNDIFRFTTVISNRLQ